MFHAHANKKIWFISKLHDISFLSFYITYRSMRVTIIMEVIIIVNKKRRAELTCQGEDVSFGRLAFASQHHIHLLIIKISFVHRLEIFTSDTGNA